MKDKINEKNIHLELTSEEIAYLIKTLPKKCDKKLLIKLELSEAQFILAYPQKYDSQRLEKAQEKIDEIKKELNTMLKSAENDILEKAVWKTKEGFEVPMSLMEDTHILNAIWKIQRNVAKKTLLEGSKLDVKRYLHLAQYDALCYHAVKRGLAKKESVEYIGKKG